MGFLITIWNLLMRAIGILGMILMETMIFGLVYFAIVDTYPVVANLLAIAFVIFIISEVILRVVVGGGVNVFKYLIGRFF
jgi:hypothetical protein